MKICIALWDCYTLIVYILKLFYYFLPKCLHESVIQKFRSSIKMSSNLSISYKKVLMTWPPCVTVPSNYSPCNNLQSSHALSALGWEYTSPFLCLPLACPARAIRVLFYQWYLKWRWLSYGQNANILQEAIMLG